MATDRNAQHTRDQVSERFGDVVEQVRTPLLAALGAGDLATQAVAEVVNKARAQVDRGASGKAVTPNDVAELRKRLDDAELDKLVDPQELRKLVDPGELRDLVDAYAKAAGDLYHYLAEHGESALDKLREQPQVRQALQQLEDAVSQTQDRLGDAAGDARELADEVLSRVTFQARSTGEKTARRASEAAGEAATTIVDAADDAAGAVTEAGDKVAGQARSTARKTAAKTEPKQSGSQQSSASAAKNGAAPRKTNTTRKTDDK